MRKLRVGVAAAIVVIIAVLAAPVLVPTAFLERRVAAFILDKTGRHLSVAGPIRISLVPRLAVTADDVALDNIASGVAAHVLEVQRVEASLRFLPLFGGRIDIDELSLTRPRLNLEIGKDGRRNWLFHRAASAAPDTATAVASGGPSVTLGRVAVEGGTAGYLDRRGGRPQTVTDIRLAASSPVADGPADAQGTAIWNGETIRFTVAAESLDGLRHGGSAATISLAAATGTLDFKGRIGLAHPAKAAGTVSLKAASASRLLGWAGVPDGSLAADLGALSIAGSLETGAGKIALADAAFSLGDIAAKGNLVLDRGGARPLLTGQLDFARLDLNPFWPASDAPPAAPPASPAPAAPKPPDAVTPSAPGAAPLPLPPLGKFDAELRVASDTLHLRRFDGDKSMFAVHLKDGRLTLDIEEMALYGGKASGDVTVSENAAVPEIAAKLNFANIDAGPLVLAVTDLDAVAGKGNLAFDLRASGHNAAELIASLAGSGRFDLAGGSVAGASVDPSGTLVPALGGAGKPRTGRLAFDTLSASFTISHGILVNGDLKLTSPQMNATGQGFVNLSPCRIDYRWTPVITGKGSAQIALSGSCDDPTYRAMSVTIIPPPRKK